MKAERRHELQTNTLAQILNDLPLYLRFHANKILIGVIFVCLAILLIRHRVNSANEAKIATQAALQTAESGVEQLKFSDNPTATDAVRAANRIKLVDGLNVAIQQVLDNTSDSSDPGIRAEALLTQGDMYWTLGNMPVLAGAATQPSLSMSRTPSQFLDDAEASYQRVLKNYDSLKVAKASALFGLAAIEENRGNWTKAADYYKQVSDDAAIAKVFKDFASNRLGLIPRIKTPVFSGTFSSTQPATAPSTAQSAESATAPTTAAAAESVLAPSTAPATTSPQ